MAGKYGRRPGKALILFRIILAALIAVFVLFLIFGKMDQSKKGLDKVLSVFSVSSKEIKKVTHGIDVARYQGTIDWEQAKEAGVEFAMIRLGYRTQVDGEIIEDPNARYNMQEASRNGILLGAYFFSTAINPDEAKEEAIFCANLMSQYPITYPISYNCEGLLDEENRNHVLTKGQRSELADISSQPWRTLAMRACSMPLKMRWKMMPTGWHPSFRRTTKSGWHSIPTGLTRKPENPLMRENMPCGSSPDWVAFPESPRM